MVATQRKYEIFYILYFSLLFIIQSIQHNISSVTAQMIVAMSLILLLFFSFHQRYTWKEIGFSTAALIIGVTSFYINNKIALPMMIVSLILIKGINIKRLSKYLLVSSCFILLFNSLHALNNTGLNTITGVRFDAIGNVTLTSRNGLGFVHPNALHIWLVTVFALIIYLKHDKMYGRHYLLLGLISTGVYYINLSRTGLITSYILLVLTYLFSKGKVLPRVLISLLPSLMAIVMFISSSMYWEHHFSILEIMNNVTSNRIKFAGIFFSEYPPRLFGWDTVHSINGAIIDSGYIDLIIRYGILVSIIYLVLTYLVLNKLMKEFNYVEAAIFLTFQIYNITEPLAVNIFLNYSLIFISFLFSKDISCSFDVE